MKMTDPLSFEKSASSARPGILLLTCAEEFYFWLMRSVSDPKAASNIFKALSQIMRIAQMSRLGGSYLSEELEQEAVKALTELKEELNDGTLSFHSLSKEIDPILGKLIDNNPKAQLIAHATEIEYIFCINTASSFPSQDQEKLQSYLKEIVAIVNESISEIQAKAIVQVMAQILKGPKPFSVCPHETLKEKIEKAGIFLFKMTG